jgi:hypothetical protein
VHAGIRRGVCAEYTSRPRRRFPAATLPIVLLLLRPASPRP